MLEQLEAPVDAPDIYVLSVGDAARTLALTLADRLRQAVGARVIVHLGSGKLKAQMKKADASGARFALIIGEDELAASEVSLRDLRETGEQQRVKFDDLNAIVAERLGH